MEILDGFTPWLPISELIASGVPNAPGTYMIAVNRPINRADGVDPYGILTIGKATRLRQRLRQFCVSSNFGRPGHMAGWRFSYLGMKSVFPLDSLVIAYKMAETTMAAAQEESRLLRLYVRKHFECPPLNYSFSWIE